MTMRLTLTLAAVCACLFGLLLLSGGNQGLAVVLLWILFIGFFVAVLTLTGAIRFFARPPQ
ncbi:MAG: hypothetical protein BWX79_00731 [Alphaproteobacteria bacterium ADurb.Bin100]|jgi:type VI protein secretion system component VasK|nr:MAG: hypothetical protein BWX79_00731 [Alphaproteobacteria bacterium ADurb.Bin100]